MVAAAVSESPPAEDNALGMTLAVITAELRERYDLGADAEGVVVTEVEAGGGAAERGIRPGDVILEVGLEEVDSPADVVAAVKKADDAKRKSVLLLLDRSGDQRFVAVEIGKG